MACRQNSKKEKVGVHLGLRCLQVVFAASVRDLLFGGDRLRRGIIRVCTRELIWFFTIIGHDVKIFLGHHDTVVLTSTNEIHLP